MHPLLLGLFFTCQAGPPPAPPPAPVPAPVPFISLPKAVTAKVGDRLEIKVATAAKAVTWDDFPPGLTADVIDGGVRLLVWADEGKYPLRANAYDEAGKRIWYAETVVELTRPKPAPPPPPPDKMKADVVALLGPPPYSADTLKWGGQIIALYRAAAKFALDDSILTARMLIEDISGTASDKKIPLAALAAVRARVIAELEASGVDPAAALTKESRAKVADVYTRAAAALDGSLK